MNLKIPRAWCAWLCYAGLAAIAVAATLMGPSLPFIGEEFGASLGMLGLLASVWNLGYVSTVVGGALSDRYGEPAVMALSFLLVGGGAGLASTAASYQALAASFLLAGVGAAFAEASMNPLIAKLYPEKSGFALNVLHVFWGVGAFLGPSLASFLIAKYGSWRLPYLAASVAFAPFALTAIALSLKKPRLTQAPKEGAPDGAYAGSLAPLGLLVASAFFYFGAELGINAWLPSFLMLERNFSVESSGLAVSLFWAFMAAGRLTLGSLVDKVGYRRALLSSSFLASAGILLATLIKEYLALIILWSLSGFLLGPILPTLIAWANKLFPARRGFASGAVFTVGILGAIFSPWFIGVMGETYTLKVSAFYLTFSTFILGLLVLRLREEV